jgi:hypothetical protein
LSTVNVAKGQQPTISELGTVLSDNAEVDISAADTTVALPSIPITTEEEP